MEDDGACYYFPADYHQRAIMMTILWPDFHVWSSTKMLQNDLCLNLHK